MKLRHLKHARYRRSTFRKPKKLRWPDYAQTVIASLARRDAVLVICQRSGMNALRDIVKANQPTNRKV